MPLDLAAICEHCLARQADARYPSAVELLTDLQRYVDGHSISVRPARAPERALRWARRHPRLTAAMGTALLATILGGLGLNWWQARQQQQAYADQVETYIAAERYRRSQVEKLFQLPPLIQGSPEAEDRFRVGQGICLQELAQGAMFQFGPCPEELRFIGSASGSTLVAYYFQSEGRCYRAREQSPDGFQFVDRFDCPANAEQASAAHLGLRSEGEFYFVDGNCVREYQKLVVGSFFRGRFDCPWKASASSTSRSGNVEAANQTAGERP